MDCPEQPNRFSLAGLLAVVGLISVALASGSWVVQSSLWDSIEYIPCIMVPSIPMMTTGLFFAPLACLAMIIAVIVLTACSTPRPLAPLYFLTILPMAVFVEESAYARYLLVLLFASGTTLVEPAFRRLDPKWRIIAALCFATTFSYYWMIICALATAAV